MHSCIFSASFHSKIVWEDRKEGDIGSCCRIVVDGTDFAIQKQGPGSYRKWKSKKKESMALR